MDRVRLTITLRKDLIKQIDEITDGVKIRNRSHAIESVLAQNLLPKITQAVILAGGVGVKLRPLTYEIPKALIPVKSKAVIEHTIELLRDNGIRDIIIAVSHLGEKIENHLGNGQKYGVKITYSHETESKGSVAALKLASNKLTKKPFLVINGDVLTKIQLAEFIHFHDTDHYLVTMALSHLTNSEGFGSVQLRGEKIVQFFSKNSKQKTHLVDAGIYIFNHNIIEILSGDKSLNLDNFFEQLAVKNKLAGFSFDAAWYKVSTPETYEKAIKEWES